MSFPVPPSAAPQPAADRPIPADVTTAYQLWCGVLVLAVVNLVASVIGMWSGREALVDLMVEMSSEPALEGVTREQLDSAVPAVIGLTAVGGLAIVGVLYLVVRQLRRAKNWARMALTMIGVFMTLSTLPTVFGVGVGGGTGGWALGIIGIVQAVLTVGAIVLMHRRESNLYFLRMPKD
ncbi:hypothetical protein [Rhodococcus chondri]|uniref:Integral membrane protein n=1 Tax=Rhodococcus chondri TaxID=3065941 RepID=A0ABU7JU86_9NOCA|nr:hypothetical protein [Rhodococcus sp. CC-R104]MEE2033589.1 hypothetical protein [Rhodococcus sp. CC-R104]